MLGRGLPQNRLFPSMEIDLELPSCEHEKLDLGSNMNVNVENYTVGMHVDKVHVNSLVPSECAKEALSIANQSISSVPDEVGDVAYKGSVCEPSSGLEFETKEEAYSFYREYARSVGFGITIKASRRSKKSGKFIDIKIACSRFGNKRESGAAVSSRPCIKTDCKASLHIKRKEDEKWVIHSFVKEHNHEICPEDFYYAARGWNKQSAIVACQKKGLQLALDEADVQLMLEHFMQMQDENCNFFYAIDLDHEKRLKNVLWVDAKGLHDYSSFCDVVFFDTFYITNKYKIPFVPIAGVNHHSQYLLLGCALVGEETASSFIWLMQTWLKAVGGQAPRVIITDQEKFLKEAVAKVFPDARHCFCLWHVLRKIPENLSSPMNQNENFMVKFNKCVYRSWSEEQFEKKWRKMVDRFQLRDEEWVSLLYEDREKWAPIYMQDVCFAGMSTTERSGSITSFYDKYISPEGTFKEFIGRYKDFLKDMYKMEANADCETQHNQSELRSLFNFGKQMSSVYTDAIFKKFQVEVLGLVSCHLRKESENETTIIFRVDDFEERYNFVVAQKEDEFRICCSCRCFEYRGFLCRHALLVLQMSGASDIPSRYILKRWMTDARVRHSVGEVPKRLNIRSKRFNDLSKLATKLAQEGSLCPETYDIAFQAIEKALKHCVDVKNSSSIWVPNMATAHSSVNIEDENNMAKSSKKKKTYRTRKEQPKAEGLSNRLLDSCQQMEELDSDNLDSCYIPQQDMHGVELDSRAQALDGYYTAQHSIEGAAQLNSVSSIRDGYYTNQQGIQGQLHSIPTRDGHYENQQTMQGLLQGQLSFRLPTMHGGFDIQDNLLEMEQPEGSLQFHSISSKHLQHKRPSFQNR